ncbi:hypothetical protein B0H13DRAFT_2316041 [Mycena leptocephala]|nr:hypothetical protein B0H13DRAFT_2316041 [Mycena leptocephala]
MTSGRRRACPPRQPPNAFDAFSRCPPGLGPTPGKKQRRSYPDFFLMYAWVHLRERGCGRREQEWESEQKSEQSTSAEQRARLPGAHHHALVTDRHRIRTCTQRARPSFLLLTTLFSHCLRASLPNLFPIHHHPSLLQAWQPSADDMCISAQIVAGGERMLLTFDTAMDRVARQREVVRAQVTLHKNAIRALRRLPPEIISKILVSALPNADPDETAPAVKLETLLARSKRPSEGLVLVYSRWSANARRLRS